MDDIMKAKLRTNIANSWKMYSVRFVSVFSLAVTALIGWFLSLPTDCAGAAGCTVSQLSLLSRFGIAAGTVPLVAGALSWYLRVRPQTNLTSADAEAKSATIGPAEVATGVPVAKQPTVTPTT